MSHTRLRPTFSFTDEKLAELKRIAPEAFADGRVNWEVLKEALGEHADDESTEAEHFGLNWPGKREARRMAGSPSTGALVPKPGDGLNEDSTRNVFIEGENLEVLKLLQKAYRGKVKMIYIDPPYNTGNDFVYEDDFSEPLEEYLRRTGQVDEEGRKLTTHTRADGRFHSKWLSMMYPRLRLARQLLRDDGVIFVSIDDNEVHHLRNVLDEVFGDENFVANIIWEKKFAPQNDAKWLSPNHDHILLYARNKEIWRPQPLARTEEANARYKNPDNDPRGPWASDNLTVKTYSAKYDYPIKTPSGRSVSPAKGRSWSVPKETMAEWIKENRIWFGADGDNTPRLKRFISDVKDGMTSMTIWKRTEVGDNQEARRVIRELFGDVGIFDTPKPLGLLKRMMQLSTTGDSQDIVLDFFAGSGSTGHALGELNQEDGGSRSFICVQVPDLIEEGSIADKAGYKTIADITKERLRRAFKKNKSNCGFKSLALAHSNYRAWKDYHGTDAQALEDLFAAQETPLREGWSVEGLTTEVMLLEGFPLDSRVEVQKAFKKNTVQRIHHEWHAHALFVCLDKQIHAETIAALLLGEGDTFICLDTAIDDQSKLRLSDKGMIKTI